MPAVLYAGDKKLPLLLSKPQGPWAGKCRLERELRRLSEEIETAGWCGARFHWAVVPQRKELRGG